MSGTGFDIICPSCRQVFHETTESYDPEKHPHPGMATLKQPYKGYMWQEFPKDPSAGVGCMECPGCGDMYVQPGGKLIVRAQKVEDVVIVNGGSLVCPHCQKECKTPSGLVNHIRMQHGE